MESFDLNNLRVAAPCPASWAAMDGDDRVRFCRLCSQHVYDLSSLTRDEASALIEKTEGRVCIRFFRRSDGTVLTADCPVGIRAAIRHRLLRMAAAGVFLSTFLRSTLWIYTDVWARDKSSRFFIPAPISLPGWADRALSSLFNPPPFRGTATMGAPCRIPPAPTPAAAPPNGPP